MGILSWIALGLIAGAIAKWLKPGKDPGGCIVTILIGIAGAFIGGWVGTLFGLGTMNEFSLINLLLAIGGSLIVLILWGLISNKK
jgi:uncharacterized membrane protein YeaQ/YmgE (transglycosylase-associated protein family)